MLSKEAIISMLETDKRAVARALVVLTSRQTADEQASENTRYLNGRGFRPCHARMGTNMAQFFQRHGYLTDKQIAYWRIRDRTGAMRIGIYAGQLLEEAQYKQAAKTYIIKDDVGNLLECKMVLEEILSDILDSDDPDIIDPVAKEFREITAILAKISGK
jgi:hypothetical protein